VRLAEQLVDSASEDEFDFAAHGDPYKTRLKQLIESKIEGKEIAMPPAEEAPEVINLADALKKSIARPHGGPKRRQPPKSRSGHSSKRRRRAS
jgi:DNA end-binding protein Ku